MRLPQADELTMFRAALLNTTSAFALVATRVLDPKPATADALRVWCHAMKGRFA